MFNNKRIEELEHMVHKLQITISILEREQRVMVLTDELSKRFFSHYTSDINYVINHSISVSEAIAMIFKKLNVELSKPDNKIELVEIKKEKNAK